MNFQEQLDKAIGAHGLWKARLRTAIDTGKSDFNPHTVKTDNNCDFGKWLYNDISPELKTSPTYKVVLQYHAEFHKEAGRILQLALEGNKEDAEKGIKAASTFATISSSLTATMMEWKKSLK